MPQLAALPRAPASELSPTFAPPQAVEGEAERRARPAATGLCHSCLSAIVSCSFSAPGVPAGRCLGDPVEHDAEQDDREPGRQALAVQLALREAGDDVVAERAGADQAADDDHRQHVDQALVGRERQRAGGPSAAGPW